MTGLEVGSCAEGSAVGAQLVAGGQSAQDVAAFYDGLLPDWTRDDIGLAESL